MILLKSFQSIWIDTDGLDIQITSTESDTNNGSVPAIFANIPIKDMRNSEK